MRSMIEHALSFYIPQHHVDVLFPTCTKDLNVAVVLVNQCMSDPGAMAMFATVKPVGGHVLAHASTTRVHLKKGRVRRTIRDVRARVLSVFIKLHITAQKADYAAGSLVELWMEPLLYTPYSNELRENRGTVPANFLCCR